ncbi:uncharacterized protein C8A04DRAFT_34056 [Dichotomopilus funicola]|uniref:HORMA domain-containing protein n=1 Tax=Dichotomopilus funicola TaxID=1934379 RepID=A0AAN6V9Q5_9PEZI|nr:hypothetical protein C8A04DRAFT_34056 [Dichotomopilus funicola]
MPEKSTALEAREPRRDFELCKVVFVAALSQILFARHAFPPACFQLLPLREVVSRSFETIITDGTGLRAFDKEFLRDQGYTIFLRHESDYGLNRFLGILEEDIFPLIESESLINFRISYLRTKTWKENSLLEYFTISIKYNKDGAYGLGIWRGGMGHQHIANTDCQLWNLGDYLSRLNSLDDPVHWTLAFHAVDEPDDPLIGVWKFGRKEFDGAKLKLQQLDNYSYVKVSHLE